MNFSTIFQNASSGVSQLAQNIKNAAISKMGQLYVSGGQLLSKLSSYIPNPFSSTEKPLNKRNIESQEPKAPRQSPGLDLKDEFIQHLDIVNIDEIELEGNTGDQRISGNQSPQSKETAKAKPFGENIEILTKRGMKTGTEAVKESGLVTEHVNRFKTVAKDTNTILMFRAVNPMSTGLLEEGTSAKGLNVHGKSSDWGPMAGYIALDQALSKKHNDGKAIKKGNEDNEHSLKAHGNHESPIQAKQLSLSESRVAYLKSENLIVACDENGKKLEGGVPEGHTLFINGGGNDGKGGNDLYMFKLEKEGEQFKVSYKSIKEPFQNATKVDDWSELKVMGDRSTDKPLTADYDMFAMLPKTGNGRFVGKEVTKDPALTKLLNSRQELKRKLEVTTDSSERKQLEHELKSTSREIIRTKLKNIGKVELGQEDRRRVDPELGRLTKWQGEIRDRLNESILGGEGGYTGGQLVKHGTEQDNTQFSEKDEKVFVIMPDGQTFMTQSWEQTQAFMWSAKQDDYLTYTNRSYESSNQSLSPTKEQTVFYPGQVPKFKDDKGETVPSGGTQHLSFDMMEAAKKFGLIGD